MPSPDVPTAPHLKAELVSLREELERVRSEKGEMEEKLIASEAAAAEAKAALSVVVEQAAAAEEQSAKAASEVASLATQLREAREEASRARSDLLTAQVKSPNEAELVSLREELERVRSEKGEMEEKLAAYEAGAIKAVAVPGATVEQARAAATAASEVASLTTQLEESQQNPALIPAPDDEQREMPSSGEPPNSSVEAEIEVLRGKPELLHGQQTVMKQQLIASEAAAGEAKAALSVAVEQTAAAEEQSAKASPEVASLPTQLQETCCKTNDASSLAPTEMPTQLWERGVSVTFLKWLVLQRALACPCDGYTCKAGCSFPKDTASPLPQLGDLCTTCVVESFIKPMTQEAAEQRLCYIEVVRRGQCGGDGSPPRELLEGGVGHANFFVSHAWSNNFGEMVGTICHYVENLETSKGGSAGIYGARGTPRKLFWLDILSVCQFIPFQDFPEHPDSRFDLAIRHSEGVVTVMAPWVAPVPLSRMWCLFEQWCALNDHKPLDLYPPTSYWEEMQKGDFDVEEVIRTINRNVEAIHAQQAECFKESDKEMILDKIKGTMPLEQFDNDLKTKLRSVMMAVPLSIACSRGSQGDVEKLLDAGAEPTIMVCVPVLLHDVMRRYV